MQIQHVSVVDWKTQSATKHDSSETKYDIIKWVAVSKCAMIGIIIALFKLMCGN